MNYSQMVSYLREKNKGKIVFVQSGVFYIAVAQDAVFLSNALLLKTTCHKKNVCKVGVPISSIEKYTNKLEELGYAHVVYSFNKEKGELNKEKEREGKTHDEINVKKKCYICKDELDLGDDVYKEAISKLYENERD